MTNPIKACSNHEPLKADVPAWLFYLFIYSFLLPAACQGFTRADVYGEMVQWLKYLLDKYKDKSSDPHNSNNAKWVAYL